MNILVTGANGFIGKHVVNDLRDNYTIYQLINGRTYTRDNDIFTVNLLNDEHIHKFLEETIEIDIIIHIASRLPSSYDMKKVSLLQENIIMSENLIHIINYYKPMKIINFSSISVYPYMNGEYFENSEIRPSVNNEGLYGLSKFCGENILDFLCPENNIIHLRLAQVYGEGMKEDRIMTTMRKELNETNIVTVFGQGKRIGSFISIDFLVRKVSFFIKNDFFGIYNIAEENLSYFTLAERIITQYGNDTSKINLVNEGIISQCIINTDKLKNTELQSKVREK